MALQKNIIKYGVTIPNVYIQIENIRLSKRRGCVFDLVFYTDSTKTEVIARTMLECEYDNTLGTLASVYNYLKSLPEYENAIDV